MNPAPSTLAAAWEIEMTDRGLTHGVPGEEDARALFYTGAAAMMAMTVAVLAAGEAPPTPPIYDFLKRVKLELSEYLEEQDWPDA